MAISCRLNIAVISVMFQNFNLVSHIATVSHRSAMEKTSPCAIDGLFQQINMLGNNFQVLALSSSFLLLRLNMFIGIYLFSFDQSCSAQVSC